MASPAARMRPPTSATSKPAELGTVATTGNSPTTGRVVVHTQHGAGADHRLAFPRRGCSPSPAPHRSGRCAREAARRLARQVRLAHRASLGGIGNALEAARRKLRAALSVANIRILALRAADALAPR